MRKNGHDRMGRQRWQCDECRLTAGTRNNTKRRRTQLAEFLDWLLEAAPQRKRPESARNFRKRVDWCWRLEPRIEPDGVVHRVVMADGTCLCSIRDCGFSHVKVSGLVMGACRPLLQGLV